MRFRKVSFQSETRAELFSRDYESLVRLHCRGEISEEGKMMLDLIRTLESDFNGADLWVCTNHLGLNFYESVDAHKGLLSIDVRPMRDDVNDPASARRDKRVYYLTDYSAAAQAGEQVKFDPMDKDSDKDCTITQHQDAAEAAEKVAQVLGGQRARGAQGAV